MTRLYRSAHVFFVFMFFCLLGSLGFASTYDATGTWELKITDYDDGCDEYEPPGNLNISITQNGDSVTINILGETHTGVVDNDTYFFSYEYDEDGGTTQEEITVELTSASTGEGEIVWVWNSAYDYCYGWSDFTIPKKSNTTNSSGSDDDDDDDDDDFCFITSLFGHKPH